MIDKGFFNKNELCFISGILHYVNEHVEMDLDNALKLFGMKQTTTTEYLDKICSVVANTQCNAILSNGKQCSRSMKQEGFCLTHFKLHENGKLDKKSIMCKKKNTSRFDDILNKLREGRKVLKMQEIRFTYLQGDEYLYDPYTQRVYDINTYRKIGKIDKFRQLKLYENIEESI